MNLGHSHQTTIGLTFDQLNHCWHCGIGSAVHCLSTTWQLYRCESPAGHFWIRCPVHRSWAAVDQIGLISLTHARCLCHVDDADGPFTALTRWTLDVDRLVPLDTLVLPRCVIDLINRGGLMLKDDRVLYYKTRTAAPTVDAANTISAAMQQVRQWYNLNMHALTKLLLHWQPNLVDAALQALLSAIEMVNRQRPKRHWTEDAVRDMDARPMKRLRLDYGTKRARVAEDAEVHRPVKRHRAHKGMDMRAQSKGTKRRQIEHVMSERTNKRARPMAEPKKKDEVLVTVHERPMGQCLFVMVH